MGDHWRLQDAKNRFSEVVERALEKEPQVVTRHGRKVVVVMSIDYYERLVAPQGDLVEFFRRSPLSEVDMALERSNEGAREVDRAGGGG